MQPALLVIGGSHDQQPMVRHARNLGCRVLVADGNPHAPAFDLADEPLHVDTSDLAAVVELARQRRIRGVCTMATNLGPRTVARVAHLLGLPGISEAAAIAATDKHRMKAACHAANIPVAPGETCTDPAEAVRIAKNIGYPVLLKAADASGCRGIEPAATAAEIESRFGAAQRESREGHVVIERYYPASRVIGVESLIHDGVTEVVFSAEKIVRVNPRISTAGVTVPTRLDADEWEILQAQIGQLHHALGLTNGASHVDLVKVDHRWCVIDVGPRLGGGPMIHHLAPQLTGIDMIDFVVRQALGEVPQVTRVARAGVGVERFFYSPIGGRILALRMPVGSVPGFFEWRKPVGSQVASEGPNVERLGCLAVVAENVAAAETVVASVAAEIEIEIETKDGRTHRLHPGVLSLEAAA